MILPPTGGKVKRIPRQGCTAQTKRPRPTTPAAAGQNLKSKGAKFLSTPSARRATGHLYRQSPLPHISIHALREEGDLVVRELLLIVSSISIHALREEGDWTPISAISLTSHFYPRPPRGGRLGHLLAHFVDHLISIHALREEGDLMFKNSIDQSPKFLSTPSARRATRSVRGLVFFTWISIHALREEGDIASLACSSVNPSFLSTPSARRATFYVPQSM